MIGQIVTDKDGAPVDGNGKKLSESSYQPSQEVLTLMARAQKDYGVAWRLQHRPFREFDGYSLLQRDRMDNETVAAYVGAEYVPQHKKWRWRGRKNTARNKVIGMLAHMISGILYPYVNAKNSDDEDDKVTGECATIIVENALRGAKYDTRFLSMAMSALCRPAVIVHVEYIQVIQRIKQRLASGEIKIKEAIDELLSGLQLNVVPVDEFLLADFYTNDVQQQPYICRVRRIPWDYARQVYAGKYKDKDGKDLFSYVQAGKTRVVLAGQTHQTLFDIEWTEADQDYVQELTFFYRPEDLQFTILGGVFMGNEENPYNSNPFEHRRMTLVDDEWMTAPVYPFAKSGFELIDASGRFAYYKSAAFKEFWDDATQNEMHRLLVDGTKLDVFKPMFISGLAKVDSTVIAPSAVAALPSGSQVTPYDLRSNLSSALQALNEQKSDITDSTLSPMMMGQLGVKQTAFAVNAAMTNAKIMLGLFSFMLADLVKQVGELSLDLVIAHTMVGQLDASVPEALDMKFKTILAKGTRDGKDVTHKIMFSTKNMGRSLTKEEVEAREWELYDMRGKTNEERYKSTMHVWEVNPYAFCRTKFTVYADAEKIINGSLGLDRTLKDDAFNKFKDPMVWPFVNQKKVIKDFVVDEYAKGNPDDYLNENAPDSVSIPPPQNPQGQPGMMGPNESLALSNPKPNQIV